MLTDEQVFPTIYFWANRLRNKTVPFNALVNEAYIVCKTLKNPLLLQKWAKWTMLHYISTRQSNVSNCIDITACPEPVDTSFSFKNFMEMQEDLCKVIQLTCNSKEQNLLYLLFWANMTYREIAKIEKVSFQAIFFRAQKVLRKLGEAYDRRNRQTD